MIENVRRSVLPNGVRVVTEQVDTVASVALGIWSVTGSRDESDDQLGISHLLEHMLFKGTERRPVPKMIADEMDAIGGYLNAFTDKEYTCYYARLLGEHVPIGMDLLSDMYAHSVFDPEELARERNVVLEEIKGRDDDPEDLVHDLFGEAMHPGHPLGRPVIGTAETVSALDSGQLRDYASRHYCGRRTVVSASGNLDHDRLVDLAGEMLGSLPAGNDSERGDPLPFVAGRHAHSRPTEQVHFCVGTRGFGQFDRERYALALLDSILGGSMGSRLFQEIRETRGLAYAIGSYATSHREGGSFAAYGGTSPGNADQCVDLVLAEFAKLRRDGVTESELERAKVQFRVALVMGQESMSSRMNRLGKSECVHDRVIPLAEMLEEIERVGCADIQSIAQRTLPSEASGASIVSVGPFSEEDWAEVAQDINADGGSE
ncbi:MAG: M16 family metallopeptidase [Armatimonadota bacterium]